MEKVIMSDIDLMKVNYRKLDNLFVEYLKKFDREKLEFLKLPKVQKQMFKSFYFFEQKFIDFVVDRLKLKTEPKYQSYPVEYLEMAFSPGLVKFFKLKDSEV